MRKGMKWVTVFGDLETTGTLSESIASRDGNITIVG